MRARANHRPTRPIRFLRGCESNRESWFGTRPIKHMRVRVLLLRCVIVLCDCVCVVVRRVWCVAATVGKSCDAYAVFVCVR